MPVRKKISKIPLELVPIEEDGFHLMIIGYINGKKANLLIDTGASKSVFDIHRIRNFFPGKAPKFEKNQQLSTGLGTNTLQSSVTTLCHLSLGGIKLANLQAILLDLSHINLSYQHYGIKTIDGVIGSDLLKKLKAQINFLSLTLKVYFPTTSFPEKPKS